MRNAWIALILVFLSYGCATKPRELSLASNGRTEYVIVADTNENVEVSFAVEELNKFLEESTGAEFKVVSSTKSDEYAKKIIVGKCPAAVALLGKDVIEKLKPQELLVATRGTDLILIGEGQFGVNYAVYSFLENELGVRWYTALGEMMVPKHHNLSIPSLNRREQPAFEYRYVSEWWHQIKPEKYYFFFRNRQNRGINTSEYHSSTPPPPAIRNITPDIGPSHSLEFYLNPDEKYHPAHKSFPKPRRKGVFKTNPEFFSMNKSGKRVKTMQLCFSNQEMRKLLTQQIADVIDASGAKGIVALDANDVPGNFCYCPECKTLEDEYGCIGGPLYDYLIELCGYLKINYPEVMVKTLAYRKKQSEIPPKNIKRLPDNLIIVFAPIDDNFAATLKHPTNQETYEHLKQWCKIAKHVWVWYYSNPYLPERPPFGNIERMVEDVKSLHEAGVTGTQFEHGAGTREGFNFAELQNWLFLKLFQNPYQDTEPLVIEFTDYYYGNAASLMREYISELEGLRKEMKIKLPWNPSISMFRYLTPERIVKWESLFDKMETLVADNPDHLFHVQKTRASLDLAAIDNYQALKNEFPEFRPDLDGLEKRFRATYKAMLAKKMPHSEYQLFARRVDKMLKRKLMLASLKEAKPLPKMFKAFSPESIKQSIPVLKLQPDAEAAYEIAQGGDNDELPFTCGIYDQSNAKWLSPATITLKDIKPDRYEIYRIGKSIVTQQCLFWGSQKWTITVPLEQFYELGNPNAEWDIYASLKFEGPLYGSQDQDKPNRVFCDRIILVKAE